MPDLRILEKDGTMMRFGKIAEMDRSFDIEYWQKRSSEERFSAVWEMVVDHHLRNGGSEDELRLQRNIEHFQRKSG